MTVSGLYGYLHLGILCFSSEQQSIRDIKTLLYIICTDLEMETIHNRVIGPSTAFDILSKYLNDREDESLTGIHPTDFYSYKDFHRFWSFSFRNLECEMYDRTILIRKKGGKVIMLDNTNDPSHANAPKDYLSQIDEYIEIPRVKLVHWLGDMMDQWNCNQQNCASYTWQKY